MRSIVAILCLLLVAGASPPATALDVAWEDPDAPVPVERPPTCLRHNPRALTNVCVERSNETRSMSTPIVLEGAGPCLASAFCAPLLGFERSNVEHPILHGWVEATVLCPLNQGGCRLTF